MFVYALSTQMLYTRYHLTSIVHFASLLVQSEQVQCHAFTAYTSSSARLALFFRTALSSASIFLQYSSISSSTFRLMSASS